MLLAVHFVQLPKMVSHRGQPQRFGKLVVMLYECVSKEAPELFALAINYSQFEHYARERRGSVNNVIVLRLNELLGRPSHRVKGPLIVLMRSVNSSHDRLISLDQSGRIHARLEVQAAARIVS